MFAGNFKRGLIKSVEGDWMPVEGALERILDEFNKTCLRMKRLNMKERAGPHDQYPLQRAELCET